MCKLENGKLSIDDSLYASIIDKYKVMSTRSRSVQSICADVGNVISVNKSMGVGAIVERKKSHHLFNSMTESLGKQVSDKELFVVTSVYNDMVSLGEICQGRNFKSDCFSVIASIPNPYLD